MAYYNKTSSLNSLLGQMNEREIPDGLAEKIIATVTKLPQDSPSNPNSISSKLNSEPIATRPCVAMQKGRKYSVHSNIGAWHKVKKSGFFSHNPSRAALYIGGMVLFSSLTVSSSVNQDSSQQINISTIANNIQDTAASSIDSPLPSIAAQALDIAPPVAPNTNKIAATIETRSKDIMDNSLLDNSALIKTNVHNNSAKLENETAHAAEKPMAEPSIDHNDTTMNDETMVPAGRSEVMTANTPDSIKNDPLDDIPIIVRQSDPSPKSDAIIETDKIEPRFGITDNPLQKSKPLPESDDSLTPIHMPAKSQRLPFPAY